MKVLFVCGTQGHDPKELYNRPTGGTLTSLTKVPEYLVSKGHEVFVSSSHHVNEKVNGVQYILPEDKIPNWDVTIFNRNILPKEFVSHCKKQGSKIIWWLHDIVDPRYLPDDTFKSVDHIVALSQYCRNTFSDFYGIKSDKFTIISNGIDPTIFYPGPYEKHNQHLFITASAPIKGQAALEPVYMNLKNHDLDLDFRIYSSQTLHHQEDSKYQSHFLSGMSKAGAHIYSPVNQKTMAEIMRKSWALLMPNTYPEICSNLLLQARACGLPVISSNIGANPEFIEHGKTGLLTTRWHPHDIHSWMMEFARYTCTLQRNKELHKKISEQSPKDVPTWEDIGEKWNELFKVVVG